jgi:hypothetical protein
MHHYSLCFAQLRVCLVNSNLKCRLRVKIYQAVRNWVGSNGVSSSSVSGYGGFSLLSGSLKVLPDDVGTALPYNFFISTTPVMYG